MKLFFHLIIITFPIFLNSQNLPSNQANSAKQLIETIIKNTGSAPVPNTVDVIKEGDPETQVKGIITCMFATMEVLKKAVNKNCNFIIVHEPLYYNHLDNTEQFQNDSVYLEKKKFIDDHNLVVWRFHDYIHRIQPDGIISGMIEKLGWENNKVKGNPYTFSFPPNSLTQLLKNLKSTFPENSFYVVGDPEMELSNVIYIPGASGSDIQIRQLQKSNVDVVVAGEVPQWETYEYVRDAVAQGRKKAIIFIGHINSEEYGMKFCADWLSKLVGDIPVFYIECGSSYWTY
ncbi:Nif3-like dinuclear metal center hexameric protein [Aestuariivivens sediminis]|uniref:Nif3-like dinuclear metal center hexameric protein n=1 Tax=Aestuariivivens sediminis TaxID=2913557 RepID=UPI001F56EB3A|nr:Nif3-like dinuclear metal center hexameric protein [Aestuariivivens sediminis]